MSDSSFLVGEEVWSDVEFCWMGFLSNFVVD